MGDASTIPGILEQRDEERYSPVGIAPEDCSVTRLLAALDMLNTSYRHFASSKPQPLWYYSSDHTTIMFPDITIANFVTHYWAFWIICITKIRQHLDVTLGQGDSVHIQGLAPEAGLVSENLMEFSVLILKSIDYLIQEQMGLYGVASVALPFHTASNYIMNHNPAGDEQSRDIVQRAINNVRYRGYQDILSCSSVTFCYPKPVKGKIEPQLLNMEP